MSNLVRWIAEKLVASLKENGGEAIPRSPEDENAAEKQSLYPIRVPRHAVRRCVGNDDRRSVPGLTRDVRRRYNPVRIGCHLAALRGLHHRATLSPPSQHLKQPPR